MDFKSPGSPPSGAIFCCFVICWYIPIHSYNHFSTENECTHIFSDYSTGNFGELRSRISRLWSLFQRFDHHSSHFQFPYPLSPLRWISMNFAHASWTTSRCGYPSPGFLCMLSVIANRQRLPEACECYFNTISHQFISISSKFHYWIPYISTIWSS